MSLTDELQQLRDKILRSNLPSLFTGLEITDGDGQTIRVSATEIIELAEQITREQLETLEIKLQGQGLHDDPYILGTPEEWLGAAASFPVDESSDAVVFYKIGGQLVTAKVKNRYVSSVENPADTPITFVSSVMPTLVHDLTVSGMKERIVQSMSTIQEGEGLQAVISAIMPFIMHVIHSFGARVMPGNRTWQDPAYRGALAPDEKKQRDAFETNLEKTRKQGAGTSAKEETATAESNLPRISQREKEQQIRQTQAIILSAMSAQATPEGLSDFLQKGVTMIQESAPTPSVYIPPETKDEINLATINAIFKKFLGDQAQISQTEMDEMQAEVYKYAHETLADKGLVREMNSLYDCGVAVSVQNTLANRKTKAINHIPITVAALAFSEPSRYNTSFLGFLALLDLIQAQSKTPDTNEAYNLHNAMVNPEYRNEFVDAYGVLYSSDKSKICLMLKTVVGHELSDKEYLQVKKVVAGNPKNNIGGYHSMAHDGSYKDTKRKTEKGRLNIPQQKTASILLQWLAMQFQQQKYHANLIRCFLPDGSPSHITCPEISEKVGGLLSQRIRTFDFLCEPTKQEINRSFLDDAIKELVSGNKSTFIARYVDDFIIANRDKEPELQREYDKRYGLIRRNCF